MEAELGARSDRTCIRITDKKRKVPELFSVDCNISHSSSIIRIVFAREIKSFNHHNPLIPTNLWWWKNVKAAQVVWIVLFAGQARPCSANRACLSETGSGKRAVHLPPTTIWACFSIFYHRKLLNNNKIWWRNDFVSLAKTNVVIPIETGKWNLRDSEPLFYPH